MCGSAHNWLYLSLYFSNYWEGNFNVACRFFYDLFNNLDRNSPSPPLISPDVKKKDTYLWVFFIFFSNSEAQAKRSNYALKIHLCISLWKGKYLFPPLPLLRHPPLHLLLLLTPCPGSCYTVFTFLLCQTVALSTFLNTSGRPITHEGGNGALAHPGVVYWNQSSHVYPGAFLSGGAKSKTSGNPRGLGPVVTDLSPALAFSVLLRDLFSW